MIPTRLWWDSHTGRGSADHDGVSVRLRFAPILPGLQHIAHLDYAPGVVALVRLGCDRERELTAVERRQCSNILRRVSFVARAEFLQPLGTDLGEELGTTKGDCYGASYGLL